MPSQVVACSPMPVGQARDSQKRKLRARSSARQHGLHTLGRERFASAAQMTPGGQLGTDLTQRPTAPQFLGERDDLGP